jgi:hypothetical protein
MAPFGHFEGSDFASPVPVSRSTAKNAGPAKCIYSCFECWSGLPCSADFFGDQDRFPPNTMDIELLSLRIDGAGTAAVLSHSPFPVFWRFAYSNRRRLSCACLDRSRTGSGNRWRWVQKVCGCRIFGVPFCLISNFSAKFHIQNSPLHPNTCATRR